MGEPGCSPRQCATPRMCWCQQAVGLPLSGSLPSLTSAVTDAFGGLTKGSSGRSAWIGPWPVAHHLSAGQAVDLTPALTDARAGPGGQRRPEGREGWTDGSAAVRDLLGALAAERRMALVVEDVECALGPSREPQGSRNHPSVPCPHVERTSHTGARREGEVRHGCPVPRRAGRSCPSCQPDPAGPRRAADQRLRADGRGAGPDRLGYRGRR